MSDLRVFAVPQFTICCSIWFSLTALWSILQTVLEHGAQRLCRSEA